MNGWLIRVLIILAAGACLLRMPQLDRRPLHNDEGVNAWILQGLVEKGEYRYDPHEYHGPTLHYISYPFIRLWPAESRMSDTNLRIAPVVFGAALILLLIWLRDGLGRAATLTAGLLLTLSPSFVFYSRYFIHEIFLIFFTLMALGAGWRYVQTGRWPWAAACGAGIGLMYATKETFVFQIAAAGAGILTVAWTNARRSSVKLTAQPWWNVRHWLLGAGAGLFVAALFFTSFFTHPQGILDAVRTYEPWINRAGGQSPLVKPWPYYFEHLLWFHPKNSPVWTEAAVWVLGLVGIIAAFLKREIPGLNVGLARFLVVYTAVLTLVYNVIPYKTPWCLLVFHLGWILLAGIGVALLLNLCKPFWSKALLGLPLLVAAAHLGLQVYRLEFIHPSDHRFNPFVHSQTSPNLLELVKKVEAVAAHHPDGTNMLIKVVSPNSYWPLPWYLRKFNRVGYWDDFRSMPVDPYATIALFNALWLGKYSDLAFWPVNPYAPIMLVNSSLDARLDEKSDKRYLMVGLYAMRPAVRRPPDTFLEMYVELELWKRYVEALPKTRDPDE